VASRRKCTARSIGAAMCAISSVTNYKNHFHSAGSSSRKQYPAAERYNTSITNDDQRNVLSSATFWHQISSSLPQTSASAALQGPAITVRSTAFTTTLAHPCQLNFGPPALQDNAAAHSPVLWNRLSRPTVGNTMHLHQSKTPVPWRRVRPG